MSSERRSSSLNGKKGGGQVQVIEGRTGSSYRGMRRKPWQNMSHVMIKGILKNDYISRWILLSVIFFYHTQSAVMSFIVRDINEMDDLQNSSHIHPSQLTTYVYYLVMREDFYIIIMLLMNSFFESKALNGIVN